MDGKETVKRSIGFNMLYSSLKVGLIGHFAKMPSLLELVQKKYVYWVYIHKEA